MYDSQDILSDRTKILILRESFVFYDDYIKKVPKDGIEYNISPCLQATG